MLAGVTAPALMTRAIGARVFRTEVKSWHIGEGGRDMDRVRAMLVAAMVGAVVAHLIGPEAIVAACRLVVGMGAEVIAPGGLPGGGRVVGP